MVRAAPLLRPAHAIGAGCCAQTERRKIQNRKMSGFFFSQSRGSVTQSKKRILTVIKKRSFCGGEFVCPSLTEPEVTDCDGSRTVRGSEGSARALGKTQIGG